MKKRISFLVLTLVLCLTAFAQADQQVYAIDGEPHYEGALSTTTTPVGFPAAALSYTDPQGRNIPAKSALIFAETAGVNFTIAGSTPSTYGTTDVGIPLNVNSSWVIKGLDAISKFLCINQVASSGAVLKYIIMY